MTKQTTILILILALCTAGLLYLALHNGTPQKITVSPSPTPMSPNAKTMLSIDSAPATLSSALSQHTVEVVLDTTNPVNGVQLELSYDPAMLTNVKIAPGTYFTQPNELINNINTTDGRISYALVEQLSVHGHNGKGPVALISFDVKQGATISSTMLSFLPKTAVTADGILESVLKKTSNYTLSLLSPTPTVTPTGQY